MFNFFLDLIFPQQVCPLCREPGYFRTRHPWCNNCHDNLIKLQDSLPICDRCGKYLESGGNFCMDCITIPPPFYIARAVGPYEDSYRIAIKVFKFLCRKYLGIKMAKMMAEVVRAEPRFENIDMIVPVPISQKNLRERGFNQTEILANQISKELKISVDNHILQRVKETAPQRELSREERQRNLLYAFEVKESNKIAGKSVLLVDDVFTTGSTSRECARILLQAGADKVSVITWATGKGF